MKTQIKGARDALKDLLERSADSIIGERMSNNIILVLNHQVTTDHPILLYNLVVLQVGMMIFYTMHLSMVVVLYVPNVVHLSQDHDPKHIVRNGVQCYHKELVKVKMMISTTMMTERYVILYHYFQSSSYDDDTETTS